MVVYQQGVCDVDDRFWGGVYLCLDDDQVPDCFCAETLFCRVCGVPNGAGGWLLADL